MAVDTNNINESIFDTEDLDSESIFGTSKVAIDAATPQPVPMLDMSHTLRRRADIDTKQDKVAKLLEELSCEGVVLLMPAHVAWFTGGMNIRGLIADGERPGIYTNGRQRWLLASNIDGQRLFDEELDGLGFQLKEWQWTVGRALLLGELVAGKEGTVGLLLGDQPALTAGNQCAQRDPFRGQSIGGGEAASEREQECYSHFFFSAAGWPLSAPCVIETGR